MWWILPSTQILALKPTYMADHVCLTCSTHGSQKTRRVASGVGGGCALEERDSRAEVKWKQRGAHVVCEADIDPPPPPQAWLSHFTVSSRNQTSFRFTQQVILPSETSHYPDLAFLGNSDSLIILADIFCLTEVPHRMSFFPWCAHFLLACSSDTSPCRAFPFYIPCPADPQESTMLFSNQSQESP